AIIGLAAFSRLTTASIFVAAEAQTCGTATFSACSILPSIQSSFIDSFGSVSVGGVNSSFGHGDAQIDWFHNHFGLLAEGDTNTTASDGAIHMGGGQAFGVFFDTLTVAPLPVFGVNMGDPGLMQLKYHLDGTIHIDAPAFETAIVHLNWDYGFAPAGMGFTATPA